VEPQEEGNIFHLEPGSCPECIEKRESRKQDQKFNFEQAEIVVTTTRRPVEGRTRRAKGVKTGKVVVSSHDTILVLKLKILEKLEIEPNEQALFFGDVELKNPNATLQNYHVPAKATIYIERRQLSADDYDILDGHNQIEEGFKGTIFSHGKSHVSTSSGEEESEDSPKRKEDAGLWACAICTFSNLNYAKVCEMCETPRFN